LVQEKQCIEVSQSQVVALDKEERRLDYLHCQEMG
jgi:hypothetical protein